MFDFDLTYEDTVGTISMQSRPKRTSYYALVEDDEKKTIVEKITIYKDKTITEIKYALLIPILWCIYYLTPESYYIRMCVDLRKHGSDIMLKFSQRFYETLDKNLCIEKFYKKDKTRRHLISRTEQFKEPKEISPEPLIDPNVAIKNHKIYCMTEPFENLSKRDQYYKRAYMSAEERKRKNS